jgi:hypothetical protein
LVVSPGSSCWVARPLSLSQRQKSWLWPEPKGMTVNTADVEAFRKIAQEKVWPAYQKEYADIWEGIVATKV